ncbi:MAG TPA: PEP-CTERM-box response regulator transcription factor [Rhizomicrobium sp.]|jgi:two-component system NtrC family response regulator|nr:PEP-CTERM-box response regulator transcription factor [Rhizomicrobium sp.]
MSATGPAILVVEDDDGLRSQYRWLLSDFRVMEAGERKTAIEIARTEPPGIAIVDLGLPPDPDGASEGLATVVELLEAAPETKIIVVTGNESREYAARAVASGAYDFFQKPADPELLKLMISRAARLFELEQDNKRLAAAIPNNTSVTGILGNSAAMQKVLRDIERLARTDITVLILGESGTGKELVADALHRFSPRKSKPFVAINCAAIPEGLLEAELFGHEKGAFTGAVKQTIGKIESANGGTLFLDEVGDIPFATQVKLLRFLEERVIERVGGRQSIRIDTRVVSATNQDLAKLIAESRFREDLLYRINEVTISLPPLRERGGDSVLLANYFLRRYAKEFRRTFRGFSNRATEAIRQNAWRGNVRELESRVKRAAIMAESAVVVPVDLELDEPRSERSFNLREARARVERDTIELALAEVAGNISKAAGLLGISRPTLYDLLNQHGLSVPRTAQMADVPRE